MGHLGYKAGMSEEMLTLRVPAKSLGPRAYQIAQIYLDNPKLTNNDIARQLGISYQRVGTIFNNNRFLDALRKQTRSNLSRCVPLAGNAVRDTIIQNDAYDAKLKASFKVLEDQRVIGPDSLTVNINPLDRLNLDELRELVGKAHAVETSSIEGELIA